MGTRTVRLDQDAEKTLARLRKASGLSISEVRATLSRAFELMVRYSNVPMDLADASLVIAAECLDARKVFTIDRRDFGAYRIRRGHRHLGFEVVS